VVDDRVQTFVSLPEASDRAVIQFVDKTGKTELVSLPHASFNLALALLASGRRTDSLAAYERAAAMHPSKIEEIGLADLTHAQVTWLSKEEAAPVLQLLDRLRNSA